MGSQQWLEVGDFLVELGHELARFGLLDMELGLWENEIMHRMDPASFIPSYLLHRYYYFFSLREISGFAVGVCLRTGRWGVLTVGIGACLDAWRGREMEVGRLASEAFEGLGVQEKRVMIAAIKEDDRRIAERTRTSG